MTPGDLRGNPWVFDHDFFLLVNVAVGGIASESPGSSVTFPQTMLIDYIRIYEPAASWPDTVLPAHHTLAPHDGTVLTRMPPTGRSRPRPRGLP